jgi:hypothetical protein
MNSVLSGSRGKGHIIKFCGINSEYRNLGYLEYSFRNFWLEASFAPTGVNIS